MPEICGYMVGNRPRGFPCILLAVGPMGNAPMGFSLLFGYFPNRIRYSGGVSIAEKVSNTLWAFPKEWPITFRDCSNSLQKLIECVSAWIWAFPWHFPLSNVFFIIKIKKWKTQQKNLKTNISSSPNYDLFHHSTYSQTQTSATAVTLEFSFFWPASINLGLDKN